MLEFLRNDDGWLFGTLAAGVFAATIATFRGVPAPEPPAPELATEEVAVFDLHLTELTGWDLPPEPPLPIASAPEPALEAVAAPLAEGDRADLPPAGEPEVLEARRAPEAEGAPAERPRRVAKKKKCEIEADPAIVALGEDQYRVQRAVVQRYSRNWKLLDELGWSKSHRGADGKADGMEIGGIRCGSDLYDAGFRSGDVVHSVNGKPIKNIGTAILAYTALHRQRAFTVILTRRGERKTLEFSLVG